MAVGTQGPGSHLDMVTLLPGGSHTGEEPPEVAPVSFESSLPSEKVLTLTSVRALAQSQVSASSPERAPGIRAEQLGQEAKGVGTVTLTACPEGTQTDGPGPEQVGGLGPSPNQAAWGQKASKGRWPSM